MLLSLYEFREHLRRKVLLILRAWQQLHLHVYRKHVWHLERKERLVKSCLLRHALQLLLAWSVSRCMYLPTNQDVAAKCTTNITWRHSQTTWIPFKTCCPPVSAVRLFHVRAVALRTYDFLQLIAVHWLGLHQLITCKSSEQLSINTDLTVHLYLFRHLKVHDQEDVEFLCGVRRFETDVPGLHVGPSSRVFLGTLILAWDR
jgi:hypothetical protein